MAVESPAVAPQPASGLKTALDVIVAPKEAFETLREVPMWGWALFIILVLCTIGFILSVPEQNAAVHNVMMQQMASNPQFAQMTEAQKQAQLAMYSKFAYFGLLFIVVGIFLVVLLQTLVFLIFNVVGRGSATFKQLWAATMNIAIIFGIGYLIQGLLSMIKGPGAFASTHDLYMAMPSAAWIVPSSSIKATALLSTITPFTVWSTILAAMMMRIVARVSAVPAWLSAILIWLVAAIFASAFAR